MLKALYLILTISVLLMIVWLNRGCEANTKSPPFPVYSKTEEQSKADGLFEFEVVLYKSNLVLDSGLVLKVKDAWVEYTAHRQVLMFGKALLRKDTSDHQLILNLEIVDNAKQRTNNLYYFLGHKRLGNYIHLYCNNTDTIRIPIYREPTYKHSSKETRKAFDSLTFIKR